MTIKRIAPANRHQLEVLDYLQERTACSRNAWADAATGSADSGKVEQCIGLARYQRDTAGQIMVAQIERDDSLQSYWN